MCRNQRSKTEAKIAQLGERMTEDHKVRCSIHLLGAFLLLFSYSTVTTTIIIIISTPILSLYFPYSTNNPLFPLYFIILFSFVNVLSLLQSKESRSPSLLHRHSRRLFAVMHAHIQLGREHKTATRTTESQSTLDAFPANYSPFCFFKILNSSSFFFRRARMRHCASRRGISTTLSFRSR